MTGYYSLTDVVVRLLPSTGSTNSDLNVGIFSDNSGAPGSEVDALTTSTSFTDGSQADYTYDPSSPLTLAGGSTYWLVLEFSGTGGPFV